MKIKASLENDRRIDRLAESEIRSNFLEAFSAFKKEVEKSVSLSENRIGVAHTGRQNRVLMAFAKAIAHAISIHALVDKSVMTDQQPGMLDHFSVGALSRTLIDASLMTLYLSHPYLNSAEWDLRRHILFLHDATNRKRFLTAMHQYAGSQFPEDELSETKRHKQDLIRIIKARGKELGHSQKEVEEFCKGQTVFIGGVRGAVREAGRNLKEFEFLHTYLSNHVHSHPVSLLRTENISFEEPTAFQMGFCALCLEGGGGYLSSANKRIEDFTGDMALDPNGQMD